MSTFSVPSRPSCCNHFLDPLVDLGFAEIGGQAQPGGVVERLADGQVAVDDVVLGHVAHLRPELGIMGVQILAVETTRRPAAGRV